ncbi:hypothetical protein BGZ70_000446 [Mortierella alpina]|uniref:Uncharacterized protein n=1 Tax=Mortierella alpina TaxID=64518 RepID=A0A9P6IY99_MORAP|nr:hypothetical protein BGZ70_000446 [Mortierella alpina]
MLSSKVLLSVIVAVTLSLSAEAASFRCNRKWQCEAIVSNNNVYKFSRKEGCTGDGRYCSHATNNDLTDIKIWVRNGNAGCQVTGNFDQWIVGC